MKKIINGKKYDTDTAKKIATHSRCHGDFSDYSETLYLKKTGEFFLYGSGGPMSKYATPAGQNSWSGGSEIIPLSKEKAQKWAEKHLGVDEYETLFGEVEE